ncbi:MAG: methionyl-tRNA formyltransferase [Prolixibacteraceae bacterium]|jgi:methionyl-tRNA formyltransferase|nr:methionyl-tRNA formyltransferase [Prolixibacteraceae bacterium]MBT6999508.1 methionyl-tRNA formyltransferase [Prolixibacteraceae bacterium]MBT7395898.1 methionyl-tRNA formyltransferase [Prolixibacteraceae bacterium]
MFGKKLRIIFMGTPEFAVASLKALFEGAYNVVGVITAPDKPAGRGKKINESSVKKYAVENNLKILQPGKLKNPEFLDELKLLKADLQVIVAFRMLPEVVWNMPKFGTFNLHGSLLPQYRGAAPLNWAIINGETKTGVTTFLLDQKIDTGKILFNKETEIGENETVGDVHDRLMEIGAKLVVETVEAIAGGNIQAVSQSELIGNLEIKHAPKIFKDDCKINWTEESESIRNQIRGLSPYPAAWTNLTTNESGQKIQTKIFFATKIELSTSAEPGTIKTDGKTFVNVACGNGWLQITDLQIAGKKRMKTEDFLRGFKNIEGHRFE